MRKSGWGKAHEFRALTSPPSSRNCCNMPQHHRDATRRRAVRAASRANERENVGSAPTLALMKARSPFQAASWMSAMGSNPVNRQQTMQQTQKKSPLAPIKVHSQGTGYFSNAAKSENSIPLPSALRRGHVPVR
jgi:hypothetical protein